MAALGAGPGDLGVQIESEKVAGDTGGRAREVDDFGGTAAAVMRQRVATGGTLGCFGPGERELVACPAQGQEHVAAGQEGAG
jgi:hypothetical protein